MPGASVLAADGHDWITDTYSKSTWFAAKQGWYADPPSARASIEGRVAFAGSDIAAEGAGWIEGAVRSGSAAAADVLRLLRDRPRAQPAAISATPVNAAATPANCHLAMRSCRNHRASNTVATG